MIHVSFHGAEVTVQPWAGDDGETGRALLIRDAGIVITLPLGDEACREIAGSLMGGLIIPQPGVLNGGATSERIVT